MEVIEDDLFFAELSEQIALLIMDDQEEELIPLQCQPLPVVQGLQHVPQAMAPPPYTYYEVAAYTQESKGTGVFIPRFTAPRRKHRAGRSGSNNNNASSQKKHHHHHHHHHQQEKKRVAASNAAGIAGQKEKPKPLTSH